jgi:site-specific recombinase XerD
MRDTERTTRVPTDGPADAPEEVRETYQQGAAGSSTEQAEQSNQSTRALVLAQSGPGTNNPRVDVAIAAWLHAKFQRSHSSKTRGAYAAILGEFRATLAMEGLDLDSADPRRCRADLEFDVMSLSLRDSDGRVDILTRPAAEPAAIEELSATRAAAVALVAQAYAARATETRYGPRPAAQTTANLRLAVLSSFYTYSTRQDLLRGPNPIARVERRRVEAYVAARPLAYEELQNRLATIDVATDAGLRDYALLLVALHTGRRVAELAGMRLEHLVIRKRVMEITWPRCKGGKMMRDELPRGGARGEAADALVAWVARMAGLDSGQGGQSQSVLVIASQTGSSTAATERPVWVSLASNGTAGHALTARAIAYLCERRLGTSKVHTLRHTFARAMEDAGAKVSEIQAALGHADLGTTGRYLARLHQGENHHLARLSSFYGLSGLDQRTGVSTNTTSARPRADEPSELSRSESDGTSPPRREGDSEP